MNEVKTEPEEQPNGQIFSNQIHHNSKQLLAKAIPSKSNLHEHMLLSILKIKDESTSEGLVEAIDEENSEFEKQTREAEVMEQSVAETVFSCQSSGTQVDNDDPDDSGWTGLAMVRNCYVRMGDRIQINRGRVEATDVTVPINCTVNRQNSKRKKKKTSYREDGHECQYCSKRFKWSSLLQVHLRGHTGARPFVCHICWKDFPQQGHLQVHMLIHGGKLPFDCQECDKSFKTKSELKIHFRRHSGERPFQCDYCGKVFIQRSNLIRHKLTHTDERPFICSTCNKAYKTKSDLNMHHRTHTGERPFVCEVCSAGFTRKGCLRQHMFTHSKERPFTCAECQKSFKSKKDLYVHSSCHTGERPYGCTICGDRFRMAGNRRVHHLKYHTNKGKQSRRNIFKRSL